MCALSIVNTIKLSLWYQESVRNSVLTRFRNSGSLLPGIWILSVIASVRNSGVSARRELTVIITKMFHDHILALKMNYNVFTICRKITKTLLGLEFTI